jgi:hypothetical protein
MKNVNGSWNTYHPLGLNRIVRFPELYEIRFSVYAPESRAYTSKFYHLEHFGDAGNVIRTGAHSVDCSYAAVELFFAGFFFRLEFANTNGSLSCRATPIAVAEPHTLILVEVTQAWNLEGEVELGEDNVICLPGVEGKIKIAAGQDYHSVSHPGAPVAVGVYASEEDYRQALLETGTLNGIRVTGRFAALAFPARMPLLLTASGEEQETKCSHSVKGQSLASMSDAAREHEERTPAINGGPFAGCYRAVLSVTNWSTVWDYLHELPYSPVSRSWIDNYMVRAGFDPEVRGPLIGLWDSFFHGILQSVNDRHLAESNLCVALGDHALLDEGYPPNYIVSTFLSGDRSQPPLGALAAWKMYRRFENSDFLEWVYPRLKKWRDWWQQKRDGNRDGLLEWGSDAASRKPGNDAGTLFAAKCESGMDNSPLYDDADYDVTSGTMNLTDIGLNSLFAADVLFLAKIAAALGKKADKESLDCEFERLSAKINGVLWNEERAAYMDKYWHGEFSSRLGPTSFYPLLARIPTLERALSVVQSHLLNEQEFWGEFVIPTISRDDPAFGDQIYWRGRIWPPVNYLVYLGLKMYGLDEVAHQLALRSARLFLDEWNLRGHCHENYNAISGEADDVPIPASFCSNGSDRFYPWGALLALMGIEQLFDIELENGIRFGCKFLEEETKLTNVPFGNSQYSIIASSSRTVAFRDGREFYASTPGTNVRYFESKPDRVTFSVAGNDRTSFSLSGFQTAQPVTIYQREKVVGQSRADKKGSVVFELEVDEQYGDVVLAGKN